MPVPDDPHRNGYETALRLWVAGVLHEYRAEGQPAFVVIFAPSEGPRPREPYATVQVIELRPEGHPTTRLTAQEGGEDAPEDTSLFQVDGHYEGVVSVNVFGISHREMLTALGLSRVRPDVANANHGRGLSIIGEAAHIDGTADSGTRWIRRSRADFRFVCAQRAEHPLPPVASVGLAADAIRIEDAP